jgi:predicted DNA-binding protein
MMPLSQPNAEGDNNSAGQQQLSLELSDAAWEQLLQLSENQGRPLGTIAHELIRQRLS